MNIDISDIYKNTLKRLIIHTKILFVTYFKKFKD